MEEIKITKSKPLKPSQNQSSFNHHKPIQIPSASWCFFQGAGGSWGELKSRTITGSQVSIWYILVRKSCFFAEGATFSAKKKPETWSWGNSDLIYVLSRGSLVEKGRASFFRACFLWWFGRKRGGGKSEISVSNGLNLSKSTKTLVLCRAGPWGRGFSWNWPSLPLKEGPGVLVTGVNSCLLSGNHATLMEKKGTYYALVAAQDLQNWIKERFMANKNWQRGSLMCC